MILINTTVLSNFALAQMMPLLADFCGVKALATDEVLGEFAKGIDQGILPATSLKWLKRVKLRGAKERALQAIAATAWRRRGFVLGDRREQGIQLSH